MIIACPTFSVFESERYDLMSLCPYQIACELEIERGVKQKHNEEGNGKEETK